MSDFWGMALKMAKELDDETVKYRDERIRVMRRVRRLERMIKKARGVIRAESTPTNQGEP